MVVHTGGCHCGAVQYEVEAPAELQAELCNCSICAMTFDGRNWEANADSLAHLSVD